MVHCNVGSFPQVSVPEREKSELEEGGGGSEKAGAMEKRDSEDVSGLKSPARFQLTLVPWKQLPHESINDF